MKTFGNRDIVKRDFEKERFYKPIRFHNIIANSVELSQNEIKKGSKRENFCIIFE